MTLRSILLGTLMAILVNIGPIYSGFIVESSWSDYGQMSLACLLLFVLAIGVNALIRAVRPTLALTGSELRVILAMGMVAMVMQGEWLTGFLLGIISEPYYFSSPENQWGAYVLPHLPDWLVVSNRGDAVKWFHEGLPAGMHIPWLAWILPLFWWLMFLGALTMVCLSIAALLRKQWVVRERLPFPLAEVPLILMRRSEPSLLPDFLRSRLFKIGFGIVFFTMCWNMINWFIPYVPKIPIIRGWYTTFPRITLGRGFLEFVANMDVYVMGFAYLTNVDVLLSIWFFHVLSLLQVGLFNRLGYSIGSYSTYSNDVALSWQCFGGLLVLVLWWLWMARSHLKDAFTKAFTGRRDIDDSGELISYRVAVFGLILGLLYMIFWLHKAGMAWGVTLVFLGATFVLYIGLARIIAETGMVYVRGPISAQTVTWHALGSMMFTGPTAVALVLSRGFICDGKGFILTSLSHIAKLGDPIPGSKRRVVGAVALAALVGFVAASWYVIYEGYHAGASNFGAWTFRGGHFNEAVNYMKNPFGPHRKGLLFLGIGGMFTGIMTYLRYRFLWWPLHPIGFTVSQVNPVRNSVFGIFVVWAVKSLVIRVGGKDLYRKTILLFLGMLVGYVVGVGMGFLVDVIWFNGQGHPIHGF